MGRGCPKELKCRRVEELLAAAAVRRRATGGQAIVLDPGLRRERQDGEIMSARKSSSSRLIPCGGKGWRDGKCFDCKLDRGRDPCPLKNVPREFHFDDSLLAALERQQRRWWRGGVRGRHATAGKRADAHEK